MPKLNATHDPALRSVYPRGALGREACRNEIRYAHLITRTISFTELFGGEHA